MRRKFVLQHQSIPVHSSMFRRKIQIHIGVVNNKKLALETTNDLRTSRRQMIRTQTSGKTSEARRKENQIEEGQNETHTHRAKKNEHK